MNKSKPTNHIIKCALHMIMACMVLGGTISVSADDWFCSEASSKREGKDFVVCGVSRAGIRDLATARESALQSAKFEFHTLCRESSADCSGHQTTVEPMRTACSVLADGTVQCFRSIRYSISDQLSDPSMVDVASTPESESTPSNKSPTPRKDRDTAVSDYKMQAGSKLRNANGDRQIILSTVPPVSEVKVFGKVDRTIQTKENPSTILIHPGDKELLVSGDNSSYKAKKIKLESNALSDDLGIEVLQVFLEKK